MGKWVKKKLGEVAKTFTGLTYSPNQVSENGILVLRSSNIKDEQLCLEDNVFVSMDIPERAIVHENDILICVRNGSRNLIGKSTFIPKEAEGMAFGAFMTILRSDLIEPRLLLYIWQSNSIQRQVANNIGATINQITNTDFKNFDISFPSSLSEQRRIASILSSADKVIDSTQKLIAKYKQIKQGMMEDLLKPKEGWKLVKLGEVINDSYAGGTPNRSRGDYFGGGISWVTSGEVNNPEICSTLENITIEGLNNSSAKWIPENSILVALYGATAGQVSMLRIKATSNQAVLAVIPNAEFTDTMFLFYQIVYNKDNLLYLAQGSGQPNLSKNLVDRLEISIPDLPEQCRIASILSGIDKKIESEEKVLEKYKKIKKGLMEKLLNE